MNMICDATFAALRSLGYTDGASDIEEEFLTEGLPDPKDMTDVLKQIRLARQLHHHQEPFR